MAMFSFDEQAALFDVTPLPNQFILNYLPEASGDAVRVYLFGLVACYHHEAISDLQQMARELNMTEDDIRAAYRYWERKGLVQRVADNPPQYRYQNIYQVMMTGAQAHTSNSRKPSTACSTTTAGCMARTSANATSGWSKCACRRTW